MMTSFHDALLFLSFFQSTSGPKPTVLNGVPSIVTRFAPFVPSRSTVTRVSSVLATTIVGKSQLVLTVTLNLTPSWRWPSRAHFPKYDLEGSVDFHAQLLLPLSQGTRKPSIVDAVTLMLSIGKQGSLGRSGLQRASIVPGLAIRPEDVMVDFPSSLTKPGIRHSRLNQPYQSGAGSFFTHTPSISVLPGSKSLGVSSAMTQVSPISALIDSKQSSWVSVSHGPTQENDPSAGETGDHALTGVAVVAATSEDVSRAKPIIKPLFCIPEQYRKRYAFVNGF